MAAGDRSVEEEEAVAGGTATEGARGPLHASSLPSGNTGRALARKLGCATMLTLTFPVQALRGSERGCCEGWALE